MWIKSSLCRRLNDPGRGRQGAILFLAVGTIAVMAILALGVSSSVLQEIRLSRRAADSALVYPAGRSVAVLMPLMWTHDETPGVITSVDLRTRQILLGERVAVVRFWDEQRLVNIDQATKDILRRLPGLKDDQELIEEIFKKNFAFKEELLLIETLPVDVYAAVKDEVTVRGSGPVNLNTAGVTTMMYLGMNDDLIDVILKRRAGSDGEDATDDDEPFLSDEMILTCVSSAAVSTEQKTLAQNLVSSRQISFSSAAVTMEIRCVEADAWQRADDKKRQALLVRAWPLVMTLDVASGRILSWQES